LNADKAAVSALLDLSNPNPAAEIRMPPIVNFQILTDMGRMNGH
jgi:hypothetical protein